MLLCRPRPTSHSAKMEDITLFYAHYKAHTLASVLHFLQIINLCHKQPCDLSVMEVYATAYSSSLIRQYGEG